MRNKNNNNPLHQETKLCAYLCCGKFLDPWTFSFLLYYCLMFKWNKSFGKFMWTYPISHLSANLLKRKILHWQVIWAPSLNCKSGCSFHFSWSSFRCFCALFRVNVQTWFGNRAVSSVTVWWISENKSMRSKELPESPDIHRYMWWNPNPDLRLGQSLIFQ